MLRVIAFAAATLCAGTISIGYQQPAGVRLAMVNVPDDVVRPLLPLFSKEHNTTASIVYTGNDPFAVARAGNADLVISHFGHDGVEPGSDVRVTPLPSNALENQAAVRFAGERGAYVLWGVPPFLRWKRQQPVEQATDLEPLVIDDPALQRMMVAIVVNPKTVKGVNSDAARKFQDFLLTPAMQARVAAFRYPDFDQQVWWPAGRHSSARE